MKLRCIVGIVGLMGCMSGAWAQAGEKVVGEWKTIDDKSGDAKSIVKIFKATDGLYYGKVLELFKDRDAVCAKCEGDLKGQKVEGMTFMRGMKDEGTQLRGSLIDPESGKTYYGTISLESDGRLKLRGSLDKKGIFGRTQYWIRQK